MNHAKAKALGAALKSSVGEVPFIKSVPRNHPLWEHNWVRQKKRGAAVRVVTDDDRPVLLLGLFEWNKKGDWYLIVVSEEALGTTEIELHEIDPTERYLTWRYKPSKKRDDRNGERKALFAKKYPHSEARLVIPVSLEAISLFVEEAHEVIRDRRLADKLRPLSGSPPVSASPEDGMEAGFPEGEARERYVVHRHRERRLRQAKINEVLKSTGRLACEVCTFDFKATYGKLGNGFAHVHHKIPLKSLKGMRNTKPDELAIVCANCHAMIHLGGRSRSLDEIAIRR